MGNVNEKAGGLGSSMTGGGGGPKKASHTNKKDSKHLQKTREAMKYAATANDEMRAKTLSSASQLNSSADDIGMMGGRGRTNTNQVESLGNSSLGASTVTL